ncbi:MAG: PEP/pyruvate-binding domain-containing protein [Planctomycetota bacterium]
MDSQPRYVIPLAEVDRSHESLVGGKAARLGTLAKAGQPVPPGFCVATGAYELFVAESRLEGLIRMELERKRFEDMRWEEIWDAALRIRSAFLAHTIPAAVAAAVKNGLGAYPVETAWAVRSSSPGEDSADRSFAGLHESYLGIVGYRAVLDAIQWVWASLWSDAAMLYRKELSLDPAKSRMAVLVQAMRAEEVSGVAFGYDPRQLSGEIAIVEAVPGLCSGLVDGQVDPDRWHVSRSDGTIVDWHPGSRNELVTRSPLLDDQDLGHLLRVLSGVESLFAWPPDIEWTGRRERFTLLQARPITTLVSASDDKRAWYLTLRPGMARLRKLRTRVAEDLIPALEAEGGRFAAEDLETLSDEQLAKAIEARLDSFQSWTRTYWDEFIPFAHGVRQLAVYYNDAVRPQDPYEFVGLLQGEDLLATRRNSTLRSLADRLRQNAPLRDALHRACHSTPAGAANWQEAVSTEVRTTEAGDEFLAEFQRALESSLDLAYGSTRLAERPDLILQSVLEMARSLGAGDPHGVKPEEETRETLRQRLLTAVGPDRKGEALETLEIGRLSWRLRDNDNLLLARVESQLLRAIDLAAVRLKSVRRLAHEAKVTVEAAGRIIAALRDRFAGEVVLPEEPKTVQVAKSARPYGTPRQLIGQPAAPGIETGRVRCIRSGEDLGRFQAGEVLVCDGIQPTITHLVPLAAAIVERRGGMLIHGAIIARELGIPCVNGIPGVVGFLNDGDLVTVDGFLGIVTVGPPEFDMELAAPL